MVCQPSPCESGRGQQNLTSQIRLVARTCEPPLDVHTERVPLELRLFVQFVVRPAMNDDIVRVVIPAWPRLRIADIRKHRFATRIHPHLY
jgi:hypothetical protein